MAQPLDYREYEPEISFLIWCVWQLDSKDGVVASYNWVENALVSGLRTLTGKAISEILAMLPAWDLVLQFEHGLRLSIFSSNSGEKPAFNGNWQAKIKGAEVSAGPGTRLEILEI